MYSWSMTIEYCFTEEHEVYAAIGKEGFERLVAALISELAGIRFGACEK